MVEACSGLGLMDMARILWRNVSRICSRRSKKNCLLVSSYSEISNFNFYNEEVHKLDNTQWVFSLSIFFLRGMLCFKKRRKADTYSH